MKKFLIKPVYPREPNYKPISGSIIKCKRSLKKIIISLEDLNHEIDIILKENSNSENFHISIDKSTRSLILNYEILTPYTEKQRNIAFEHNEKIKERYLKAIECYNIEMEKYKKTLQKELNSLK